VHTSGGCVDAEIIAHKFYSTSIFQVCTCAANDPAREEALKEESFPKRSSKRARVAVKAQGRSTESEWASDRTESASHVEPSQRFVPRCGRKDVDCENPIVCTYKFARYSLIAADEGRHTSSSWPLATAAATAEPVVFCEQQTRSSSLNTCSHARRLTTGLFVQSVESV